MMRVPRIAATIAIALATGMIGFAIGRETAATPEPRRARAAAGIPISGDSALPVRRDPSAPATGGSNTLLPDATPPAGSSPGATNAAARDAGGIATTEVSAGRSPASPGVTPDGRRRVTLGDLDLTRIGYDRGDPDAPLVLIDFSDFGCPYCGEFARETYPAIDREYIQTGKVYLKYVPFLAGFANGREATRAAECAADQGRFWEMADAVYATQDTWQKAWDPHAALRRVAATAGLDSAAYWSCYSVHRPDARTRRATDAAEQVQVRVTPSFVLNGRPIEGALPLAAFRKLLDATLILEESRR